MNEMSENLEKSRLEKPFFKPENLDMFMILESGGYNYAVKASCVQELLIDVKTYELPFVPDYIEGVLNCRGEAYTVVNPVKMLEGEPAKIEGSKFVVFKYDADRFCLHISSADTFCEIDVDDTLDGTVPYKNKRVKILNLDKIEEKLIEDLDR